MTTVYVVVVVKGGELGEPQAVFESETDATAYIAAQPKQSFVHYMTFETDFKEAKQ